MGAEESKTPVYRYIEQQDGTIYCEIKREEVHIRSNGSLGPFGPTTRWETYTSWDYVKTIYGPQYYTNRAKKATKDGEYEAAEANIKDALEKLDLYSTYNVQNADPSETRNNIKNTQADLFSTKVNSLLKKGDCDKALKKINAALEKNENTDIAKQLREKTLQILQERRNKQIYSLCKRGEKFLNNGQSEEALENFESALELDKNNILARKLQNQASADIFSRKVNSLLKKGDCDKALKKMNAALEKNKNTDIAKQLREKTLQILQERRNKQIYSLCKRGEKFLNNGQSEEALENFESALELDKNNILARKLQNQASADIFSRKVNSLLKKGDCDKALKKINAALEKNKNTDIAKQLREKTLQILQERRNKQIYSLCKRGEKFLNNEQCEEALESFESALELDKNNNLARKLRNQALLHIKFNNFNSALNVVLLSFLQFIGFLLSNLYYKALDLVKICYKVLEKMYSVLKSTILPMFISFFGLLYNIIELFPFILFYIAYFLTRVYKVLVFATQAARIIGRQVLFLIHTSINFVKPLISPPSSKHEQLLGDGTIAIENEDYTLALSIFSNILKLSRSDTDINNKYQIIKNAKEGVELQSGGDKLFERGMKLESSRDFQGAFKCYSEALFKYEKAMKLYSQIKNVSTWQKLREVFGARIRLSAFQKLKERLTLRILEVKGMLQLLQNQDCNLNMQQDSNREEDEIDELNRMKNISRNYIRVR